MSDPTQAAREAAERLWATLDTEINNAPGTLPHEQTIAAIKAELLVFRQAALEEIGAVRLGCDVMLPPCTTIRAGCRIDALFVGLRARDTEIPDRLATPVPKEEPHPPSTSAQERLELADRLLEIVEVHRVPATPLRQAVAALRSADEEIARLAKEREVLLSIVNENPRMHRVYAAEHMQKQAEAALAQMRRMLEEPSEELIQKIRSATGQSATTVRTALVTFAALARHLPAEALAQQADRLKAQEAITKK